MNEINENKDDGKGFGCLTSFAIIGVIMAGLLLLSLVISKLLA